MTSALVIINSKSRSGEESRRQVVHLLEQEGIDLHLPQVPDPGQIPDLIRAWNGRVDALVLGGGDGTMNCAAQALGESDLTLGIIPLGTANDLARTLGIPTDIPTACRIIAAGHRNKVDIGLVNGHGFFNVANIGLGVEVKKALTSEDKRAWGVLSYARAAHEAYRRQRPFRVIVQSPEGSFCLRAIQVAVGNGRFYGGGMVVHESASIADGCLDLYAIQPKSFWNLLDALPWFRSGRMQGLDGVVQRHGGEFRIATDKPMPISADGEVLTSTPAIFKVASRAAWVFTPADTG